MQSSESTKPPASTNNPVKNFFVWWNVAFVEFLSAVTGRDTSFYFVRDCYSIFVNANYQMQEVLEVYLEDLNRLVRTDQVDDTNKHIFLQRRSPEGQTITDVVRTSRISLANYPYAASFFNLAPTVQPSGETLQNAGRENIKRR